MTNGQMYVLLENKNPPMADRGIFEVQGFKEKPYL